MDLSCSGSLISSLILLIVRCDFLLQ